MNASSINEQILAFIGHYCFSFPTACLDWYLAFTSSKLALFKIAALQVRMRPAVIFRPGKHRWIEAIVRYLVLPREAGSVKNHVVKLLLTRLNAQPDRSRFPER